MVSRCDPAGHIHQAVLSPSFSPSHFRSGLWRGNNNGERVACQDKNHRVTRRCPTTDSPGMCQGQSQGPLPRAGEGEPPCLALNPSPASDWLCYLIALCLSFPICLTGIATTPTAPDRGRIQWVLSREGPGPCPAQSSRSLHQGCLISAQEAAGFWESSASTRFLVGAFAIRKGVSKPSCSSGSPGDLQKTHPTDSECLLSLVGVLFRSSGQGGLAGLHSGLYHRRLIPGKVTRPHWDSVSRSANGLSRGCCQDGSGEVAAFWGLRSPRVLGRRWGVAVRGRAPPGRRMGCRQAPLHSVPGRVSLRRPRWTQLPPPRL